MRKEWEKPQLVVLTRGKPEEAVLGACKVAIPSPGPGSDNAVFCIYPPNPCSACSDTSPS